jgi:hypothetical protein
MLLSRLIGIESLLILLGAIVAWWLGLPLRTIFAVVVFLVILNIVLIVVREGHRRARRFRNADKLQEFKKALWKRTVGKEFPNYAPDDKEDRQSGERVVAYADRVIDRQINKTRGILPFNSIIIAVLSIERNRLPVPEDFQSVLTITAFVLVLAGLVISSLLCLALFLVHWGDSGRYATFDAEFEDTVTLINKRSVNIEWATVLSEACLLGTILVVLMTELNVKPQLASPAATACACAPTAVPSAPANPAVP